MKETTHEATERERGLPAEGVQDTGTRSGEEVKANQGNRRELAPIQAAQASSDCCHVVTTEGQEITIPFTETPALDKWHGEHIGRNSTERSKGE